MWLIERCGDSLVSATDLKGSNPASLTMIRMRCWIIVKYSNVVNLRVERESYSLGKKRYIKIYIKWLNDRSKDTKINVQMTFFRKRGYVCSRSNPPKLPSLMYTIYNKWNLRKWLALLDIYSLQSSIYSIYK